ncbi:MAG: acyltransferase, partial [Bacteroidota bacterium]
SVLIQVIIKIVGCFLKGFVRHVYWIYRLSRIKFGKNFKIKYPIVVEGPGSIKVGNNVAFHTKLNIGCAYDTRFEVGDNSSIGQSSVIRVGKGSLSVGERCLIEHNVRMYVRNHWEIDENSAISSYCEIYSREKGQEGTFKLGSNSSIGNNSILDITDDIIIGNNVAIGPNSVLYTHDHDYLGNKEIPWKGPLKKGKIKIEDGSWVGSSVTILPNVTIGKGAIVAAGSIVNKDVEARTLVAGVPARKLKDV